MTDKQEEALATGGTIREPAILGGHDLSQEMVYIPKNATVLPLRFPWAKIEHVRLIARILDGLCAHFEEPTMTPLGMVAMRCRYCQAQGELFGFGQMRYEHTDECMLALNDQLQKSMKGQAG